MQIQNFFSFEPTSAEATPSPLLSPVRDGSAPVRSPGPARTSRKPDYPASLIESLTEHRSAALAAELSRQPGVALAAVVYTLARSYFGTDWHTYEDEGGLELRLTKPHFPATAGSTSTAFLAAAKQQWLAELPEDRGALWAWCLAQNAPTLLRLLAFLAAASLNTVEQGGTQSRTKRRRACALGQALRIPMSGWFTPTKENFFGKVSKAEILATLAEAGVPAPARHASFKKNELAVLAEKLLSGTGWLPAPLRINEETEVPI